MYVIISADELELLELYQQLEEVLLWNILEWKTKDIVKILQCDKFVNLYKVSIDLLCNNPKVIFESDDFLKMEETKLVQFLRYLKKTLQSCISHIRFFQMSLDEYTKFRTYFKNILPDDLDDEVTQYFSNSASKIYI
ncbi:unnamed protein product [Rhizophagus irregularis]|nr:unnamed protein product [Rhizophagus irregularis]